MKGYAFNPKTNLYWRDVMNGTTPIKDEAFTYTDKEFDVLKQWNPSLIFVPIAAPIERNASAPRC